MRSFRDKVAAITGAGSGIGRALAIELAGRGCHLALSDINEVGLAETAERARAAGVTVTTHRVDVADRDAVYAWADQVVREHGRVNLIFNNAGVALGATAEGARDEDLAWLMDINFWGVVHGTRAFLPHLRAAGEGHVINISSIFGLIGVPAQSAYNAAKFAVRGFTESLRQELELMRCGVSTTSVHPGGIQTNIARAARSHESMTSLGMDPTDAAGKLAKHFRTTPEAAAKTILHAVQKDRRRVLVGPDAYVVDWMQRLMPSAYQRLVLAFTRKSLL